MFTCASFLLSPIAMGSWSVSTFKCFTLGYSGLCVWSLFLCMSVYFLCYVYKSSQRQFLFFHALSVCVFFNLYFLYFFVCYCFLSSSFLFCLLKPFKFFFSICMFYKVIQFFIRMLYLFTYSGLFVFSFLCLTVSACLCIHFLFHVFFSFFDRLPPVFLFLLSRFPSLCLSFFSVSLFFLFIIMSFFSVSLFSYSLLCLSSLTHSSCPEGRPILYLSLFPHNLKGGEKKTEWKVKKDRNEKWISEKEIWKIMIKVKEVK